MIYLIYLPALAALIWACVVKWRDGKKSDVAFFLTCGVSVFVNIYIVHQRWNDEAVPLALTMTQQVLSTFIIPLVYLYFSAQMVAKWNRPAITIMLMSMGLFLLPSVSICLDGAWSVPLSFRLWTINFVRGGEVAFWFNTADVIVMMQGVVALCRILPTLAVLRQYDLRLSPLVQYFSVWWLLCIVFAIYASMHNGEYFSDSSLHAGIYYVSFSLLITSIFVLLARGLTLRPYIEAHEEPDEAEPVTFAATATLGAAEADGAGATQPVATDAPSGTMEITDVVEFVNQSRNMATRLRRMFDDEQIYLRPGITSRDAIAALGTNRTYFARMMKVEFGGTFADVINSRRIEYAKQQMLHTDKTLSAIAAECGFSDLSTFSERFKTIEGVAPSAWRKT